MLFTIGLYVILGYLLFNVLLTVYIRLTTMRCTNKVCLAGKTVIVTGSNTGIGYESALEFAKRGARVIVACRDELKGSVAVQNIQTLTGNTNVVLKLVDLASLESIRRFANDILKTEERLDILLNNAGALGLGDHMSDDGFQLEMQVNYFGPVLLTLILVGLLKKSAPSRIVNVSSVIAKYGSFDLKKLNDYENHWKVYAKSKLCNILFTQELARRLNSYNVSVFAVHPGAIATDIMAQRMNRILASCLKFASKHIIKSPEEGAQTSLYAALEPGIEHLTGGFFSECKFEKPYKTARNPALAQQLWNETMKMLKYND